jgi:DNA helicase IV
MAFRQTRSGPDSAEGSGDAESAEDAIISARAGADGAPVDGAHAGDAGDAAEGARAVSLADEQAYVSMLYGLLDTARARSESALAGINSQGTPGGTHQARLERDISASEQATRLAQLNGIERGLCFGRTDDERDLTLYIGRIGLRDDDYELKLIDWRAPAARPFYAATPGSPSGLVRRRHIYTRGRTVTGIDDEVFDLDKLSATDKAGLSGEAALIAAVSSARTGRMADVVATIQAEQDRVIRSGLPGVLVVQGGPGTGKTVAALHRAAYLLYTHRRALERKGVLVIGPNPTFMRYISQVLPSLGETDVVLRTLGQLYPGVAAVETADPGAVVKGDVRMVEVLRRAVRNHQRAPEADVTVDADGVPVPLRRDAILRARDRARRLGKPHNVARKLFVTEALTELARAEARVLDRPLEDEDIPDARARLWDVPGVFAALDSLWPQLIPQQALAVLYSDPNVLQAAASSVLSSSESALLTARANPCAWTVADVPLLDELADLLGFDNSEQRAARRALRQEQELEAKYAAEVLQITGIADLGMVDAETLASWNRDTGPILTTAERAEADRTWAYGHVIIDEAQELSAMAWRMVARRVPSLSMTVVGDVAQTGSPAGARSWKSMLDPFARGRWREERLTVNYRTPTEIMAVAAQVLASAGPGEQPPESVRSEGVPPRAIRVPPVPVPAPVSTLATAATCSPLAIQVAEAARADLAEIGGPDGGRLAVIAPDARLAEVAAAIPEALPGDRPESLESPAALLTVTQAKGLEFDRVILADPAGILAQSANGGHDLYVAITRATHRLTVVYEGGLPAPLRSLDPAWPAT